MTTAIGVSLGAATGLVVLSALDFCSARLPGWLAIVWRIPLDELLVEVAEADSLRAWRRRVVLGALGCASIWVLHRYGLNLRACAAMALCATLAVLALVDLDTRLLPDLITVPLLLVGLVCNGFGLFTTWRAAIIGAVLAWTVLMIFHWCARLFAGPAEALGQGDAKLLAAIGAWLGVQAAFDALLVACLTATATVVLVRLLPGCGRGRLIAFGPYLAIGGVAALMTWPYALFDVSWMASL